MIALNRIWIDIKTLLMLLVTLMIGIWSILILLIGFITASIITIIQIAPVFARIYTESILNYMESKFKLKE